MIADVIGARWELVRVPTVIEFVVFFAGVGVEKDSFAGMVLTGCARSAFWRRMMVKIQISLTEEQHHNVTLLAELRDRSVAWIFRDLLDKHEDEIVTAVERLNAEAEK